VTAGLSRRRAKRSGISLDKPSAALIASSGAAAAFSGRRNGHAANFQINFNLKTNDHSDEI
jgi:hypothetical protein